MFPHLSAGLGVVYMIGRTLYSVGYYHRGPRGRILGSLICDISLLGLCGAALFSCYKLGGEKPGLISMIHETKSTFSTIIFGLKSNKK